MSSSTSLYNQSVPVLIKYLRSLSGLLTKAVQHCETKGVAQEDLLASKLADDMKGLAFQVTSCSNGAKFLLHRLGVEAPVFADDETTFPQLQERIQKTITMLEGVKPDAFDGLAEAPLLMETGSGNFQFESGQSQGVELSLLDYLSGVLDMVQEDGSLKTL
ncbi:uncharacterized protein J7T54_001832 [Emericellopsis cladophorae]|uniref:Uncharacterized protein n=1 Tax=Emericellopsis cladophorae TaxID=2686198 RepID=A0A9P9Y5P2_9HYPO|nr:uncharacterized protein J7T54_001832 [Emericellopsis cladophorae]KAI6783956.1 hypothetical protein J7T54_001832 [Emericellopsis cladophorae]